MDAQRIAVDAIVALTDCDRDAAAAFIRKFYLAGVRDPKPSSMPVIRSGGGGSASSRPNLDTSMTPTFN